MLKILLQNLMNMYLEEKLMQVEKIIGQVH